MSNDAGSRAAPRSPSAEPRPFPAGEGGPPALVRVDLDAIADNVARLGDLAGSAAVMAVVKADAYGHGLVPAARAARAGGAAWLATAQLDEALALRAGGDDGPILSWLHVPGAPFDAAVAADIDLGVSTRWALDEITAAARRTGRAARVHLKVDTGLGRNGATRALLDELLTLLPPLQAEGCVRAVGVFSHFAYADAPDHPTVRAQQDAFVEAVAACERAGLPLEVRHLANSAAVLTNPSAAFDLVRPGLAVYGLSPVPAVGDAAHFGLRPALRFESTVSAVKSVGAGQGVSYGHEYVTPAATQLALVPLGYADGIPRSAGGRGPMTIGGHRYTIAGRVCMDQVVVDVGPDRAVSAGERVVLIGEGTQGEPTVQDWADAAGTISYEVITRLGSRLPRRYVGQGA